MQQRQHAHRRENDALGAALEVRARLLLVQEGARRLHDVLRARLRPRDLGGVLLAVHAGGAAVHDEVLVVVTHRALVAACNNTTPMS